MTERLVIVGGPRTGKTTRAKALGKERGCRVISTDDFIDLGWSGASEHVASMMSYKGPWIIEGVAAVRALRKALKTGVKPCDRVLVLMEPKTGIIRGQHAMGKGVATVLDEVVPLLKALGVVVEYG